MALNISTIFCVFGYLSLFNHIRRWSPGDGWREVRRDTECRLQKNSNLANDARPATHTQRCLYGDIVMMIIMINK